MAMAQLKPGSRMRSAVCATEVMVVAASAEDVELTCGGAPMVALDAEPPAGTEISPEAKGGTKIGKRYVDASSTIELLCTKPGEGALGLGGELLVTKEAKPLPSSD